MLLLKIFQNAPVECSDDISFITDGSQANSSRDLFLEFIKDPTVDNGLEIAEFLQSVTTKRSKLGLLFLLYGEAGGKKRLVISRFPADTGILAGIKGDSLDLAYVEEIFMKSATAYKAVCFEGKSFKNDFWTGKAIDRQINHTIIEISEYWIKDFLKADFALTPDRGTKRLGKAIKQVVKETDDLAVKEEITSALGLAKSLNGKTGRPSKFLSDLHLSANVQVLVLNKLDPKIVNEKFKFSSSVLDDIIKYKYVELDNGAFVVGPSQDFDKLFEIEHHKNDQTSYYTIGKVVDAKLKKVT